MPFTSERDSFIIMAHFRSGTRNADGLWSYLLQSCIEQFTDAFPDLNVDYDTFANHKQILVHRFENKHCICKGKSTGRPTILTEEVVEDIRTRMERSPHKSVANLAAQTGTNLNRYFLWNLPESTQEKSTYAPLQSISSSTAVST